MKERLHIVGHLCASGGRGPWPPFRGSSLFCIQDAAAKGRLARTTRTTEDGPHPHFFCFRGMDSLQFRDKVLSKKFPEEERQSPGHFCIPV